jgi:hypothetical protein
MVARELARLAAKWTQVLVAIASPPGEDRQAETFEEIVAFAHFLLHSRWRSLGCPLSPVQARQLRECVVREARGALPAKGLRAIQNGRDTEIPPESKAGVLEQALETYSARRVSPEVYERFCQTTGLSSTCLVGQGINLASVFFHLSIFAILAGGDDASFAQRQSLLQATQECKDHLLKLIDAKLLPASVPAEFKQGQLEGPSPPQLAHSGN